jgi:hypothetical protein
MTVLPLALLLGLRAIAPEPASAPPGLELRWEAPPECPSRAQLLAAIDAILGEVDEGEHPSLRVRGHVRAGTNGFQLRLVLDNGHASMRELRDTSCEELTEAAALVIAMTIDPRLLARMPGPPEVPEPTPVEPEPPDTVLVETPSDGAPADRAPDDTPSDRAPADHAPADTSPDRSPLDRAPAETPSEDASSDTAPAPPLARETRRRSPAPLHFLGRAQAGIGGGPLPGAAAVLGLAAGLGGRGWRAELSASYWTPRTRTSAANPDVGVRAQLWTVGVHGCGEPRWRSLSFPLCTGIVAGAVHARGVGELEPRTVASRWVAVALEPGLVWWARPRLGVAVRAEGHAVLARPALRSEPSGTVFTSAPVGGALRAGVELRLP